MVTPAPPDRTALTDLVRRDQSQARSVSAAAGPTAGFHEFNMAGNAVNHGRRNPADVVHFVIGSTQPELRPFAIALSEVCVDWTRADSQSRILADALGSLGYTYLGNTTQVKRTRLECPEFGNVLLHIGNHEAFPRSFQFTYADQAPEDVEKAENRGAVCARVNAFWIFFFCSTHLTNHSSEFAPGVRFRLLQSAFYFDLYPDIDTSVPAIRAGDFNAETNSPELSPWLGAGTPYREGDPRTPPADTHDAGRKIDYILATFTTGPRTPQVSGTLCPYGPDASSCVSDHRYYSTRFTFTR